MSFIKKKAITMWFVVLVFPTLHYAMDMPKRKKYSAAFSALKEQDRRIAALGGFCTVLFPVIDIGGRCIRYGAKNVDISWRDWGFVAGGAVGATSLLYGLYSVSTRWIKPLSNAIPRADSAKIMNAYKKQQASSSISMDFSMFKANFKANEECKIQMNALMEGCNDVLHNYAVGLGAAMAGTGYAVLAYNWKWMLNK